MYLYIRITLSQQKSGGGAKPPPSPWAPRRLAFKQNDKNEMTEREQERW